MAAGLKHCGKHRRRRALPLRSRDVNRAKTLVGIAQLLEQYVHPIQTEGVLVVPDPSALLVVSVRIKKLHGCTVSFNRP